MYNKLVYFEVNLRQIPELSSSQLFAMEKLEGNFSYFVANMNSLLEYPHLHSGNLVSTKGIWKIYKELGEALKKYDLEQRKQSKFLRSSPPSLTRVETSDNGDKHV